ncbi:helix-turn-helix domain-containing protein [Paenibacillus sp. LMG 31461]|uniref:Helix-turn-helix domain-containing protein n=1 Tax=Paenibacillus plantarum TaxID=2654975 RepID=A0ABX1XI67_9BACL|nr:AraC family transcriptional regulator [Paenibacillus plantarum]NOU67598.1 helix-turn-helix domain-containing protein [Paenibacillus plantarum]
MSYDQNIRLHKIQLYFAYQRSTIGTEQYQGTFHAHQGIEVLIIHEGRGTLIVDQKSYEIIPNMVCVFQPYQLHHIQMDPETPFVRSIVHFEPSLYEPYFEPWPRLLAFFKHMHTSTLHVPCLYDLGEEKQFHLLFQSLAEKLPKLSKQDELEEYSLFLVAFFRSFMPLWEQRDGQIHSGPTRKSHQAERILSWLEEHYTEPLRLEMMSADLHLSPFHLSHLFTECTGTSISDYVTARRLQQAVKLLTSTDQAVARIGEAIGVTNCSYFCKMFKSHIGITPHQYRKQLQKHHEATFTRQS